MATLLALAGWTAAACIGGIWLSSTLTIAANGLIFVKTRLPVPTELLASFDTWHDHFCSSKDSPVHEESIPQPADPIDYAKYVSTENHKTIDQMVREFVKRNPQFHMTQDVCKVFFRCCASAHNRDVPSFVYAENDQAFVCSYFQNNTFAYERKKQTDINLFVINRHHCLAPFPQPFTSGMRCGSRSRASWPDHYHTWIQCADWPLPIIENDEVPIWSPLSDPPVRADVKYAHFNLPSQAISALPVYVFDSTAIELAATMMNKRSPVTKLVNDASVQKAIMNLNSRIDLLSRQIQDSRQAVDDLGLDPSIGDLNSFLTNMTRTCQGLAERLTQEEDTLSTLLETSVKLPEIYATNNTVNGVLARLGIVEGKLNSSRSTDTSLVRGIEVTSWSVALLKSGEEPPIDRPYLALSQIVSPDKLNSTFKSILDRVEHNILPKYIDGLTQQLSDLQSSTVMKSAVSKLNIGTNDTELTYATFRGNVSQNIASADSVASIAWNLQNQIFNVKNALQNTRSSTESANRMDALTHRIDQLSSRVFPYSLQSMSTSISRNVLYERINHFFMGTDFRFNFFQSYTGDQLKMCWYNGREWSKVVRVAEFTTDDQLKQITLRYHEPYSNRIMITHEVGTAATLYDIVKGNLKDKIML